jgi:hypothetical protein
MSKQGLELLQHAIRNGSVAAMVAASDSSSERWVVRLMPVTSQNESPEAITAEIRKGKPGLLEGLIASATPVRIMTRVKWAEVSFHTTALTQQRRMLGRRVTLQMPEAGQITVEQRRRTSREPVPHTVRMQASISRCGREAARTSIPADVLDISWSGIRVCCRADNLPDDLHPGELMSVMLAFNGSEQLLTARYRNRESAANGGVRVGLEFDPAPSQNAAATEPIHALIDLLAQLRFRRASERLTAQALGLDKQPSW